MSMKSGMPAFRTSTPSRRCVARHGNEKSGPRHRPCSFFSRRKGGGWSTRCAGGGKAGGENPHWPPHTSPPYIVSGLTDAEHGTRTRPAVIALVRPPPPDNLRGLGPRAHSHRAHH